MQQKEEILKQLSKANAEAQQWKARFDAEGLVQPDEFHDEKRRRNNKKFELQDALNEVNTKILAVEKANSRLVSV